MRIKTLLSKTRIISVVLCLLLTAISVGIQAVHASSSASNPTSPITIGIVVPMEHKALTEIVAGFKDKVSSLLKQPVVFDVQNAQGDLNIQRAIIQRFQSKQIDMIVPIGTTSTQMAAHLVKNKPILGLAVRFSDIMTPGSKDHPNLTGIEDEIGPIKPLDLMLGIYPNLKRIALIHSTSEKIFPEVEEAIKYAKTKGIIIQNLSVPTLKELYSALHAIHPQTETLFILKDHMVVSGIKTLVKEAEKRHIPVVSSDEGSVAEGAAFGLGVREQSIGEQGGVMAVKILEGKPINTLPPEQVQHLSVFYNEHSYKAQGVDIVRLKQAASELHYPLVSK